MSSTKEEERETEEINMYNYCNQGKINVIFKKIIEETENLFTLLANS